MNRRWLLAVARGRSRPRRRPAIAQEKPELRWGTDPTGGAPYVYKDNDGKFVGFEVELAEYLAQKLGRESVKVDADWSTLPELLDKPRDGEKGIDIVLNGYEERDDLATKHARPSRTTSTAATGRPSRRGRHPLLGRPDEARAGRRRKVGVLEGSVAADYSRKLYGDAVEVLESKDVAIMFEEVKRRGRLDATVQDNPASIYFTPNDAGTQAGRTRGGSRGSTSSISARPTRNSCEQLNAAIKEGLSDGTLQRIYTKYGLWNADQEWLCYSHNGVFPTAARRSPGRPRAGRQVQPVAPPPPRTASAPRG